MTLHNLRKPLSCPAGCNDGYTSAGDFPGMPRPRCSSCHGTGHHPDTPAPEIVVEYRSRKPIGWHWRRNASGEPWSIPLDTEADALFDAKCKLAGVSIHWSNAFDCYANTPTERIGPYKSEDAALDAALEEN